MALNKLIARKPSAIGAVDLRVKAFDANCNSASFAITITVLDQHGKQLEVISATLADVVSEARLNQVKAAVRAAWQQAEQQLLP